jgi:hypothetical protein
MLGSYTDRVRDLALLSDELRVVLAIGRSLQVWDLESTYGARQREEHYTKAASIDGENKAALRKLHRLIFCC